MQVQGITPILNVSDIEESFAWFGKLGGERRWTFGDPPEFGAVGFGTQEIFLSQGNQGTGALWLYVWVADVDAMMQSCLDEGVLVIRPPRNEAWNAREMHIRHPDGHVLRIGRMLAPDDHHDHDHPHDHDHHHHHDHPHDHHHDG